VVTLSCGSKIWAVCFFISSQSTRVTDGRTDRRTELRSQDRVSIAASRGNDRQRSTTPIYMYFWALPWKTDCPYNDDGQGP